MHKEAQKPCTLLFSAVLSREDMIRHAAMSVCFQRQLLNTDVISTGCCYRQKEAGGGRRGQKEVGRGRRRQEKAEKRPQEAGGSRCLLLLLL